MPDLLWGLPGMLPGLFVGGIFGPKRLVTST